MLLDRQHTMYLATMGNGEVDKTSVPCLPLQKWEYIFYIFGGMNTQLHTTGGILTNFVASVPGDH